MKLRKSFLKNIDNVSAEKISENYPVEWNIDKVFEASYRKYIELKKNTSSEIDLKTAEEGDILEFTETEKVRKLSVFRIFTMNKLIAAACAAAVILLIKMTFIPSKNIDRTPDIIEQNPIASQEKRTTSAKEKDVHISTVLYSNVSSADNTVCTTVSLKTDVLDKTASNVEVSETNYDEREYSEPTEAPIESEPVDYTETTNTKPLQTTEPTTETATESCGYFKINAGEYTNEQTNIEGFDELTYIRSSNAPVEPKTHVVESESFHVISSSETPACDMLNIEDAENGQIYTLCIFNYEDFRIGFNPELDYELQYLEINGRPACYNENLIDEHAPSNLIWDDGCHVCILNGPSMLYDKMLILAESLK